MKTKPRPSSLKLVSSLKGARIHLAYYKYEVLKPLCGAKLSKFKKNKILKKGKHNCQFCETRLQTIKRHISKFGVEWVCEGRWLPMEQRTFKDINGA
jgi:hypothetical protein